MGYARKLVAGASLDPEAMALEEIKSVGPGGNHLARPYTRAHYREFWQPTLFDHTAHDRWSAAGGLNLSDRLKAKTAQLLTEEREFTLDAEVAVRLAELAATAREM